MDHSLDKLRRGAKNLRKSYEVGEAPTRKYGPGTAILHLVFSKYIQTVPEREADMLVIAWMLVEAGADVNDGYCGLPNSDGPLSALFGAIGHADNIALGMEYDRRDHHTDVTPVQVAGWEGLPEMVGYFIMRRPDM